MSERWRTELRRIDRLGPDYDLVEKAMTRLPRPDPGPTKRTNVVTIVVALGLAMAGIYVAFVALTGGGSTTSPAGDRESDAITNGDLLYTKYVGRQGWSLFTLDPDTGVERQITEGYRDYGSDWSPDGTRIVYDSESPPETPGGIWVANADGSDARKLIDDGSVPAWSPDGTRIAFARFEQGEMVPLGDGVSGTPVYLYVMDADGTNVRRLTDGRFSDYSPAWSPDGTQIAFQRADREGSWLFVMNADGSDVQSLAGPLEIFGAPDWSPDGSSIAVAVNGAKDGPPGGIVLLPVDESGSETTIPGTEAVFPDHVSNPTWSSDGEWIAYVHGYSGEIVITHPDGSEQRTLNVDPGHDSIEELAWGAPSSATSSSG